MCCKSTAKGSSLETGGGWMPGAAFKKAALGKGNWHKRFLLCKGVWCKRLLVYFALA